jgi:twinkle protein
VTTTAQGWRKRQIANAIEANTQGIDMLHETTSEFVRHIACEHCGSSDANALYSDGHTYCFSCGVIESESSHEDRERWKEEINRANAMKTEGEVKPIPDRGITRDTCEHYKVTQTGQKHIYPYADETGAYVASKVRTVANKTFSVEGHWGKSTLFGQSLFHKGGKYVTLVEGELDALAAFQMLGSKWPVVSIKNGAQSALKDCKANFEWLDSFDSVVICFDADEPGKKAAEEVAELFGVKAKIVKHIQDCKDACDYLKSGETKSFVDSWWKAETYVPDGIVAASSLWDEVSKPEQPAEALYPFKGLNSLLYGFRPAELITVTAGSGLGKSQFLREILYHILNTTKWNIGGMFLEESVRKTARSIMSLRANKLLHLPDTKVSTEELHDAFQHTLGTDRIYLFDHFGSTSADNIINRIRYMAKACDCRIVFLDHLSIIISGQDNGDERKAIDVMMTRLRTLVQELNITLIVVSHLKRPNGNQGHEDGQAVSLSQLRGSGAIAQLSDAVITLERNSMSADATERHTTKVAVAKNRYAGLTGPACDLRYDVDTGRMYEVKLEDL